MRIRTAVLEDLRDIVNIYNQAVIAGQKTADTESVSVASREKWFDDHQADKYPILVAEIDKIVIGWASLSPYRPGRMALKYTAEISFYVNFDFQWRGVASKLLDSMIEMCPLLKIKSIFGIIIDSNTGSIKLMEKFGFEKWGHMPNIAVFDGKEYGHVYYGLRISR